MSDDRYNGWANYATWRVNLELVEDYARSMAEDVVERYASVYDLAEAFAQYVDDVLSGELGGPTEGVVVDYARAFVADVNWYEIAEHWTDELVAQDEDEDDDEDEDEDEDES